MDAGASRPIWRREGCLRLFVEWRGRRWSRRREAPHGRGAAQDHAGLLVGYETIAGLGICIMPSCFMIMPYGRKPTQADPKFGPAEIDFNALWDRGYVPVIKELGYEPVRADQDTGSLLVGQTT